MMRKNTGKEEKTEIGAGASASDKNTMQLFPGIFAVTDEEGFRNNFCFVLQDGECTLMVEKLPLVYSNEDKAKEILKGGFLEKKFPGKKFSVQRIKWNELVNDFAKFSSGVLLNYDGGKGTYKTVPLVKKINEQTSIRSLKKMRGQNGK